MREHVKELIDTVISNDYCVGCGICASLEESPLNMKFVENGKYMPVVENGGKEKNPVNILEICPFSNRSKDETTLGDSLFKKTNGIKHSEYTGYFLQNYAGYVKEGTYREKGSSGGMGTWIATKLLSEGLVDAIIHVKSTSSNEYNNFLFSYQISKSMEELSEGAKSKYYPIEMSEIIKYVKDNPGKYALIGIPCFIKSIRLLADKDDQIAERIKYTIGLVCGHLKTDMFAKSIAWQMGIKPNQLKSIDFRVKIDGRKASRYGVEVRGLSEDGEVVKNAPTDSLYTTSWGHGLFKFKACDFCDDVLAETADVTIGDAWLPEYVKDSMGTNIIVVRNPDINRIITNNIHELQLDKIGVEKIFQSQAGGFRHRREGLAYRLYLKDKNKEWRPEKRVNPSNDISNKRKLIYEKRVRLYEESYTAYNKATEKDDYNVFMEHMDPYINDYNRLVSIPFVFRVINKLKRTILK